MGNKQPKAAASESPTTKGGTPPKVSPEQETGPKAESSLSSDNSPSLPAYDPEKEETKGPELSSGGNRGMDVALYNELKQEEAKEAEQEETVTPPVPVADDVAKEDLKEEPVEEDSKEALVEETSKEEPVEDDKAEEEEHPKEEAQEERKEPDVTLAANEASQKVVMPPLTLDKIDQTPPVQAEPEEDDPDLMAPPVVLTDAMSSLKDTDIGPGAETSAKKLAAETSDAVMLASPITHHEVSLVEPVPVTTMVEAPPERDSISIEDSVSAADADALSNPDGIAEPSTLTLEPRTLNDVPEDSISLTSSAARGEDEMLMNIMGTSTAFPAATSNESVRGSVAVSEMTFDESQWETTQNVEMTPQASTELNDFPSMLHVCFSVKADASVAVRFTYGELPEEEVVEEEDISQIVATTVDMIFQNVVQLAKAEETRHKEKAPEIEQVPETQPIVETQKEESTSEKPPNEELPLPAAEIIETDVSLPRNVEEPIVRMKMEEIGGTIKVRFFHSGEEMSLQKYPSRVSDNQSSVVLKTPFTDIISESQDLSGTLDNVPELDTEQLKVEADKTCEKPEETVETALQEAADLAVEVEQTIETKLEDADASAKETLSPSTSGDAKKPKKTKSRKKKSLSGELGTRQSPGLRSSLSGARASPDPEGNTRASVINVDGTASVDSTGAPAAKPKPQAGRSAKGRGRGRGRTQAK